MICSRFGDLNYNMFVYGIQKDLEKQSEEKFKPFPFILSPESKFKAFWNVVIILLLFYTGTVVPYRTAFVDTTSPEMQIFELIVDGLFVIDLFVNFVSAYENEDKKIEMSLSRITVNYVTGWFFLDLIACLPFQLIFPTESQGDGGKYNKLIRLARLPRLYRLLRILRLFKLLKSMKKNENFKVYFERFRKNPGISRMLKMLIMIIFLVHLTACFWFLSAKLEEFTDDTWVVRFEESHAPSDDPPVESP